MKQSLFGLATAAALGLALLTGCPAEERDATGASPAATSGTPTSPGGSAEVPASHVDAKAIFSQKCSGCHGANGGGGMGPALSNVEAKGDEFIRMRIVEGSPEKGMPAFKQLKPEEVDALVTYVKTL